MPNQIAISFVLAFSMLVCLAISPTQINNQQEKTPEKPPLILLYDSLPDPDATVRVQSMNAEPWMNVTQDPESFKTGLVDIDAAIRQVQNKSGGQPPKWMMLDLEDPFMANLRKAPDSPERQKSLASMISAIRAMKMQYPNCKWTFYGIPSISYWVNDRGWATASVEEKKLALERAVATFQSLVAEVDWVSVSIYDVYDPKMVVPGSPKSVRGTPESVREDGRAWRMASTGLAKLMANGKPVIPTICPTWAPTGIAPYCRLIPLKDFVLDQVAPAVKAGANGFAIWTSMDYRIEQVTQAEVNPAYKSTEQNFGVSEWRSALTADYFNGVAPQNWSDPFIRQQLIKKTSRSITDALFAIRSWERTGEAP